MSQRSLRKRKSDSEPSTSFSSNGSFKKQCTQSSQIQALRAGTITGMLLKNFMCHTLFEIKFQKNTTVLCGQNGSGKSAILTALLVGLGGKAMLTNRGSSLSNFIKSGENTCTIQISIHNGGALGYRRREYGDTITVIRTLYRTGSGGYKIKSESGALVSSSAKVLKQILIALNIQIDNPVCVLNQDTSRNFLSSNDPKLKYSLFMRATRMETLLSEYAQTNENLKSAQANFDSKMDVYNDLQRECETLKRKIAGFRSANELREKCLSAKCELVWSEVRNSENELKELLGEIEKLKKRKGCLIESIANKSQNSAAFQAKKQEIQRQIAEVDSNIPELVQKEKALKQKIVEIECRFYAKRQEEELLKAQIERKTSDCNDLKAEIEKARTEISCSSYEKSKRLKMMTELKSKLDLTTNEIETVTNDSYQYELDFQKETEKEELRQQVVSLERKISDSKATLSTIQNKSYSRLSLYGENMQKIHDLIERNRGRFKQMPKGPLGIYIKVKDKKWTTAIEGFFGVGFLKSFLVDNINDNKVLRGIFAQVLGANGHPPTIITTKFYFEKFNVKQNLVQAPRECVGLYNAIEVEDAVVMNCIVDCKQIEKCLLIPTNQLAIRFMSDSENVPRNCAQAITMDGDTYYPDPNYRTYASNYHSARYLQVDSKQLIQDLNAAISESVQKHSELKARLNTLSGELADRLQKKNMLNEKIRKLTLVRNEIRRQLDQYRSQAEPEFSNVDVLESELKHVEEVVKAKRVECEKIEIEMKAVQGELTEYKSKLSVLRESTSGYEKRRRKFEAELSEVRDNEAEMKSTSQSHERKLGDVDAKIEQYSMLLKQKKNQIKEYEEDAKNLGERPSEIRASAEIAHEIKRMENELRLCDTENDNLAHCVSQYEIVTKKVKSLSKILPVYQKDVNIMRNRLVLERNQYYVKRNYCITYIKSYFRKFMEMRHFEGDVEIDTVREWLTLNIVANKHEGQATITSNLSGGERSYSTIALLFSLWQCTGCPFYFLDEFDVYMDKMNRTMVFKALIAHAKSHPDMQFVFLTPQDISVVQDPYVDILKLDNPERN